MLKIYNTATKNKDTFNKQPGSEVTIYNCGLTVYHYAHIGNLRAYTMADIIRRGLEFLGYKVKQVQNFTDVGHLTMTDEQKLKAGSTDITDTESGIDRMEKAAKQAGKSVAEIAEFYIAAALRDFAAMNFKEPNVRPRATQHIEEQKDLIRLLLDKGYAYITPSAVYFNTAKFPHYGELAGQNLLDKKSGSREEVEVDPNKINPHDFRLWQLNQKDHAMLWDFTYNGEDLRGFPGWHIECSAMSRKYLGQPIDIHTGGVDHIPVHHTNEIAQSEAAFGHPYVNYWMHNEFLLIDGRRMGKSLGNAFSLRDIEAKGFSALDLRYFYLTANFRVQQNFTWEGLKAARTARLNLINKLRQNVNAVEGLTQSLIDLDKDPVKFLKNNYEQNVEALQKTQAYLDFKAAIEDSFDMPKALSIVWNVINDEYQFDSLRSKSDFQWVDGSILVLFEFDKVLGLKLLEFLDITEEIDEETKKRLEEIISDRQIAKQNKDFATADKLREQAKQLGFELIDTKEGTKYKKLKIACKSASV